MPFSKNWKGFKTFEFFAPYQGVGQRVAGKEYGIS
jgi:hypothetical protein